MHSDGWTAEQEAALDQAYKKVTMTPTFWKDVAKLVPGKSSTECFNKVDSQIKTPPRHQIRSRAKAKAPSTPLSPSHLLLSPVPETKKQKKSGAAHKTVRELFKKQCSSDVSHGSASCEAAPSSPLVLKEVVNKSLHDRYIDQLHSREARREAASKRAGKMGKGGNGSKESPATEMLPVEDAKKALILCANEAANQFQHQESSNESSSDFSDEESEDES